MTRSLREKTSHEAQLIEKCLIILRASSARVFSVRRMRARFCCRRMGKREIAKHLLTIHLGYMGNSRAVRMYDGYVNGYDYVFGG